VRLDSRERPRGGMPARWLSSRMLLELPEAEPFSCATRIRWRATTEDGSRAVRLERLPRRRRSRDVRSDEVRRGG
jgi:hypothetical protein